MTARELFMVAVRLGGVLSWTFGLFDLVHAAVALLVPSLQERYPPGTDVIGALGYFGVGTALFFGTPALARMAYGDQPQSN